MQHGLSRSRVSWLVSVFLLAASDASAALFTNIADTSMFAPVGTYTSFGTAPTISGTTVAFKGFYSGGSGFFTGSGGGHTTIVKTGDAAPSGTFTGLGVSAEISGSTVGFQGTYSGGSGIFTGSGGAHTVIAKTGDAAPTSTFTSFNTSVAMSGNTAAFIGLYGSGAKGVFTGSGGGLTTVAKTGDPAPSGTYNNFLGPQPSISGSSVAFGADYGSVDQSIVVSNGVTHTTIAKEGDPAPSNTLLNPSFASLSGDTVAFRSQYFGAMGTQEGIFVGDGGPLTTIVKTGDAAPTGTFVDFGDFPSLSDGVVAFTGFYGGTEGIFISHGGSLSTIIATGDSLFGKLVTNLALNVRALDVDSGAANIAFFYELDDGTEGIARAVVAIPEARAWLMLGIVAIGAAVASLARRQCSRARCT